MSVVRTVSLLLFLGVMAAFFEGHRSYELAAVAAVLVLVLFWACGAFDRAVWFGTPEEDAACARLDEELDAADHRYPH